jgi:response regulator of citrate/malate metabolism
MYSALIVEKNQKRILEIAKKIVNLFPDLDINPASDIESAISIIKSEKPKVVVLNLDMKDSKGRDLLERLVRWEFEILIYKGDELYCIQDGKEVKKEGYVLRSL